MKRIAVCPNCGHKLAETNTSGKCYRPCKKKESAAAVKDEVPIPPGIVRRAIIASICEHFPDIKEAGLLSSVPYRAYDRPRCVAYYLLKHDAGMNESGIRKYMCRPNANIKTSLEIMVRNFDEYRHDIAAIKAKVDEKLKAEKQKLAA